MIGRAIPAIVLVLVTMSPANAANSISASASSTCGYISVSGSVSLDACNTISGDVRVSIFQEGCEVSGFNVASVGTSFMGTSANTYASGTYTVVVEVDIMDSMCVTKTYVYKTTVTVS